MNIMALKFGMPPIIGTATIDMCHTPHYATGYMFNQVQPRIAMATHLQYDESQISEIVAGIRCHYDGLFQFGAPDVVVNVIKEAIWTRWAALPEDANFFRPAKKDAIELFNLSLTYTTVVLPNPKYASISELEGPVSRNVEIDPKEYYPPDVYRKPNTMWPRDFKIDIVKMIGDKFMKKIRSVLGVDG